MLETVRHNSPVWRPYTQERTTPLPPLVTHAKGAWLHLEDGQKVLDGVSSWWVSIHGHANEEIAEAIYQQALTLEHVLGGSFIHTPGLLLAEKLLPLLPQNFKKIFFSDNGSTAVEVALKIAYQYWINQGVTTRKRFLSFEEGYHGDTVGAMSVSAPSPFNTKFRELLFSCSYTPFPWTYENDPDIEEKESTCLEALQKILEEEAGTFAGMILEPLIQGAGGMRFCRPKFLKDATQLAQKYGLLVIYDEVFTGFGRTGDWFACTKAETSPDLICLSKALTGGFLPMAVTAATQKVYEAFLSENPQDALFHGHTYYANPLGCAASLKSLEILEKNISGFQLMEGRHLKGLERLAQLPAVQRARACGTIAAFDLRTEGADGYLNPLGKIAAKKALERNLLIRPLGNTVYLAPPYNISQEELDFCYDVLFEVISLIAP